MRICTVFLFVLAFSCSSLAGGNPYSLENVRDLPSETQPIANSVVAWLQASQQVPEEYVIDISCQGSLCQVQVYRAELLAPQYRGWHGCPKPLCATLQYDSDADQIIDEVHWR
jgi:hypothetical protein